VQRRPYLVSALGGAYVTFRAVVNQVTVARVVHFAGTGALAPETATLGSDSAGLYPNIAAGNGELAVIYSHGTASTEIVLTRLTEALVPVRSLTLRTGTKEATNPVVQWNGSGWVTAWEDTATGDVWVQTALVNADASSVGPMLPLQNGNSNWPELASNGNDTVVAFYGFPDTAQIMLAHLDKAGQRLGSVIQVSGTTGHGRFPSVAYSSQSGDFGVVWPDEASGEIVYAEVDCR
jgi:hypothetical protein